MNLKKTIAHILETDENVKRYVASLERDIENTKKVDKTIDKILDNILNCYSDFTDRRHLKSTNIEAVTNLLKLQSELPMKRVQAKKILLDMLTKKIELEIKNKSAIATNNLATSNSDFLKAVFLQLDEKRIHPKLDNEQMLSLECKDIIDVPIEIDVEPKTKKDINDEMDIVAIQQQLDLQ